MSNPILVVDDDPDMRLLTTSLLRDAGFSAEEAPDGKAALARLLSDAREEPWLILLDLVMPEMSGWELLQIVQSYPRLSAIPVVVVSGSALDAAEAPLRKPVHAFLPKPVDPAALLARVRDLAFERGIIRPSSSLRAAPPSSSRTAVSPPR